MAIKLQTSASTPWDAGVLGVGLWKFLGQASVFRLGKWDSPQKVTHPSNSNVGHPPPTPCQLLPGCSLRSP